MRFVRGFIICSLAALGSVSASAEVIDDFESYTSEQIVGPSAQSSPWCRIGVATIDNVIATANSARVIDGKQSGHYLVRWPARFGSARYRFESPRDLQNNVGFSLKLKSDAADSGTQVQLLIGGAESVYLAKAGDTLGAEAKRYSVEFDEADFELVYGTASFSEVITQVQTLGFQVTNSTAEGDAEITELIVMDDLMLTETAVEPE